MSTIAVGARAGHRCAPAMPIPSPRRTTDRLPAERIVRLVRAAAAGDRAAWNRLVSEFEGMIWAVTRAHRLPEADAADASQAVWLALCEHLDQLNEPARVGAWLATTARRECLRVLREGKRRVLCGEDAPEPVATGPLPVDSVLRAERDDALWRSFMRLRVSDRALLRLLMAEPRPPYEEIASVLDVPIGSIGPTRRRALERLRREMHTQGTLELIIG